MNMTVFIIGFLLGSIINPGIGLLWGVVGGIIYKKKGS